MFTPSASPTGPALKLSPGSAPATPSTCPVQLPSVQGSTVAYSLLAGLSAPSLALSAILSPLSTEEIWSEVTSSWKWTAIDSSLSESTG